MALRRLQKSRTTELARLVDDDRAFDVKIVEGALTFFNEWNAVSPGHPIPLKRIVDAAFGWLPGVLAERARYAGISSDNVKWDEKADTAGQLSDVHTVLFFLLCSRLDLGRNVSGTVGVEGKRHDAAEWLDKRLSSLPIYSRYRFDGKQVTQPSVPLITSAQKAVAHALAVILKDRWHIRERVRRCPYERKGMHFFLDYRIDKAGRLASGQRKEFCCKAHAGAVGQQRWRDNNSQKR